MHLSPKEQPLELLKWKKHGGFGPGGEWFGRLCAPGALEWWGAAGGGAGRLFVCHGHCVSVFDAELSFCFFFGGRVWRPHHRRCS